MESPAPKTIFVRVEQSLHRLQSPRSVRISSSSLLLPSAREEKVKRDGPVSRISSDFSLDSGYRFLGCHELRGELDGSMTGASGSEDSGDLCPSWFLNFEAVDAKLPVILKPRLELIEIELLGFLSHVVA